MRASLWSKGMGVCDVEWRVIWVYSDGWVERQTDIPPAIATGEDLDSWCMWQCKTDMCNKVQCLGLTTTKINNNHSDTVRVYEQKYLKTEAKVLYSNKTDDLIYVSTEKNAHSENVPFTLPASSSSSGMTEFDTFLGGNFFKGFLGCASISSSSTGFGNFFLGSRRFLSRRPSFRTVA
jgi:hypothetical protein